MAYRRNIGHSVYSNGVDQYLMRSGISYGPTDKFFLRIVAKAYHPQFYSSIRLFYIGTDYSNAIKVQLANTSGGPDSTYYFRTFFNTSAKSLAPTGPIFNNVGYDWPNIGRFAIVYVWDGTYWCVYWSGGRVRKNDCGGTITATTKDLYIGADPEFISYGTWPGWIDDVIIDTTKIPSIFTTYPDEYDELFLTAPDFCDRLGFTPEHMWTFENAANLELDTGDPGGWDLTAYNNIEQGDPLCGELVDGPGTTIVEYNGSAPPFRKLRLDL